MLFDVMSLNRHGGHGTTADTRMDQHSSQLVCRHIHEYKLLFTCYSMNTVSSDVIVTHIKPGLLATTIPIPFLLNREGCSLSLLLS